MAFKPAHVPFASPTGGRSRHTLGKIANKHKTLKARHSHHDFDQQQEVIYPIELNFMDETKIEDSYMQSYPFGMKQTRDLSIVTNENAGLYAVAKDLHRHVNDDADMKQSKSFVGWSHHDDMTENQKQDVANVYYKCTQAMVKSIDENKANETRFSLLPTALNIKGIECVQISKYITNTKQSYNDRTR